MRILLIVHGLPPACTGGTETYTWALARALAARPGLRVGILSREADVARPELSVRAERRDDVDVWFVNNTFQSCAGFEDTYRNPALCAAVVPYVDAFGPDVAHVQHLTALSTELVEALRGRGIPVVMTLNDYWPMCHRGQLLNVHGQRCDGPGSDGCAGCIPTEALAPPAMWRAARRFRTSGVSTLLSGAARRLVPQSTKTLSAARAKHMRSMLDRAVLLLAPSETLRERYRAFGIDDSRLVRCEQGIARGGTVARGRQRESAARLRVLFAGSLMQSKAPALLLDALDLLPDGAVHVDFVGTVAPYHGDHAYASALLARLGQPAVERYGPAPHERVSEAIGRADVVIVPSVWIENAPFVIKEAFACGVPVIASRLGGMAELVRDGVDGLLYAPGDARSLAGTLRRLAEEPDLLANLKRGIQPPAAIDAEAERLEAVYRAHATDRSVRRHRIQRTVARSEAVRPPAVAAVVLNYRTPDETFVAVRSIQTSRYPADVIVVDNGSGDGPTLRTLLSNVEIVETRRNLGFSGGCNVGITRALERGAEAVLLFNSDAILQPGALALLVDALRTHPSSGIVAPVLCAANEPVVVSSAGISYDPSTGRMRHRGFGQPRSALGTRPATEVDAASGCALLVRREVFERCGMLDEAYFFSFEDVEFCLRARAAGFTALCVSAATVFHKGSTSIGAASSRRVYYGVRNHLRLAQQVAPRSMFPRFIRGAAILAYNAAYVMSSPDVSLLAGAAALSRGSYDHFRGRYGSM